jgi:hypothetical protein
MTEGMYNERTYVSELCTLCIKLRVYIMYFAKTAIKKI